MIVIKNIEFLETDKDVTELFFETPPHASVRCLHGEYVDRKMFRELIRGQRFRRPDGTCVVVGLSKQSQDILGLQYDAWDNIQRAYDAEVRNHARTINELYGYKSRVEEMIGSSFWQRLKWLIFGYK